LFGPPCIQHKSDPNINDHAAEDNLEDKQYIF